MKTKPTPEEILTAIRAKCIDCCCHSRRMVEQCELRDCPLYPYRSRRAIGMEYSSRTEISGQIDLTEILKAGEQQ